VGVRREKTDQSRAPVWIVQLAALILLGFFVYLESSVSGFKVSAVVWGILAAAILPPEIIARWDRFTDRTK